MESNGGRKRPLRGRVVLLALTAICLYFFAPSIGEVFAAWGRLGDVHTAWIVPAIVCAIASYGCVWVVQAIAIGTRNWFAVITTQLAGNAFNRITPGGGATGMVMQTNMLTAAGINAPRAATALTVQSVLSTAALVAMPVFSIPFIIAGTQIPSRLLVRGLDRHPGVPGHHGDRRRGLRLRRTAAVAEPRRSRASVPWSGAGRYPTPSSARAC